MNLKINILTKKRFTNFDIFISCSLFYHKFHKITKTLIMAVAEEATKICL